MDAANPPNLPAPSRRQRPHSPEGRVHGGEAARSVKQRMGRGEVATADLDRAAQLAPYRYQDGMAVVDAHRLETEHFRYHATRPAQDAQGASDGRRTHLTLTVYPLSECARFYLEGEGAHYRRSRVKPEHFADHVAQVERELRGYWGPALSTAR